MAALIVSEPFGKAACPMMNFVSAMASAAATIYLHTSANRERIVSRIGLPAYQMAGNINSQNDAVQASAIPAGPRDKPIANRSEVTANSRNPHRSQRSALPRDK